MTAPTAIPALAPVERPFDDETVSWEGSGKVSPVAEGAPLDEAVGVGASNSSLVTLKQGTCCVNFVVSTNV